MTKIAIVEGDGIGREVIPEAEKILRFFLPNAEFVKVELGFDQWKKTGSACSKENMTTLKEMDAVLFGAVTTPPDPEYKSVLLEIRHELDLYANIRPVKSESVDLVIVRENTEGLYSGIEEIGEDKSTTLRVITKAGSRRIAEKACSLNIQRNQNTPLVIGHKANVLKSDILFRDTCITVAESQNLPVRSMFIDALCLDVLLHPDRYDVIVTTNMFGDILSDACGYLTGGLGMLPSANIGENHALFEPVHGSAPDIAGRNIANPIAAVRSAAMLLEYLGMKTEAEKIEKAVQQTLSLRIVTPDLGGNASTRDVGENILAKISEHQRS
ncbi:isocitrate/isopropylmalate dehydrogenase family protein [Methanorbis furvi]|uniref:Homoisocitrate dehydrogenase n=1 Tax=Methanorbis furvi TaxID=3028299 RepID=A0AAE4ME90_9EURY|nr:Homoisocitrate dehydrogenase [Methanocorpusculaceae archaeon Ag1]